MTHRVIKKNRSAGFTIIEMLVVIALIGLMAGLASQVIRSSPSKLRLDQTMRTVCNIMRLSRSRAIATNSETSVIFNFERKIFISPITGETVLPKEVSINLSSASFRDLQGQDGAIIFFPNGGSTGIDMLLRNDQLQASISVNWLTGSVTCRID